MGMILRIASSRIVGQGDIVGRSGYFSLNLSANSVMRGRLDARRTLKSLVADLRNIIYQEKRGAKMFTYGGIVCNESVNIDSVCLDNFDFITKEENDAVYRIDVPILTHRETLALNQILFDKDKEKEFIEDKIITENELMEYKKIYKYCPSFHDVRI